ncbi:MAG TPA: hypothetical protein DFH97_08005 [Clostridiales bacterium]|nr:hypothetical protein [Clostridiales bacterium]
MKRILFLTTYASPYRVRFFDELGKTAQVTVLYSRPCADVSHRDAKWFEPGQGGFRSVQLKTTCTVGGKQLCFDVCKWLKKGKYDAIFVGGYSSPTAILAMLSMRLRGIPFTMEVDGGLIRPDGKLKFACKRFLVRLADRWLSTGKETTRYLIHYGAKPENIREYPFSSFYQAEILPDVVPQSEKLEIRQKLGIGEAKMLLAIGQFIPRKGFDVLLKAAAQLDKTVGIYFVGGEATPEYTALRETLGLTNVHFVGFKPKAELAEYYKAADAFVLPTREDIWGLVINEAMAYGLPVVTTDRCVAGMELVENGVNGYLVPVADENALAYRLRELLSSDMSAMGRISLKKIQNYTLENMAKAHMDYLQECGK